MKVTVSVPGKVNIMGEHAIVYGKPSILAAVNLRMTITVERMPRQKSPDKNLIIESQEPTGYIRHAIEVVQKDSKLENLPPMKVTVTSQIPSGYHLGSSAAVAVGTVGAVTYFLKKLWNPIAINQLAYEVEKKQHGNPSGGDNTAVTMGGFLWYRKELEFLKSMWQLPIRLPKHVSNFFLIDTGKPKETTGEMVAMVAASVKRQASRMEKLFSENEIQTKRVAVALKEGNENTLTDAIREGERTLERMGVVSKKVMPLIRKIEASGGAAKILGGGGQKDSVGFLLGYHHDRRHVEKLCKVYGFTILSIELGGEGVRLETKLEKA